jgi:anaerobic C4-dicarboxylate transporter DcuA
MATAIVLQFIVVLVAIWMGASYSGVGLGLWGTIHAFVAQKDKKLLQPYTKP